MILKASQRGGGKQLGLHLLKTEENEHVEVHEVSGFVADSVRGAMKEAHALSRGTHCQQYLFSVSLNPPVGENARLETFELALKMIEERMALAGQPRIVVFHEKEGRRHCHAVWSRIDAATMTAKPLPFFKTKLREIARQLFLENGWKMPGGFADSKLRDPRSFTLDEWQQAKRAGLDAKALKEAAQEAWAAADSAASFGKALEERGLFLAQGDRRGHVAVTIDGDVLAISRLVEKKAKEVTARVGDPAALRPVEEVRRTLAGEMGQRLKSHIAEAKRIASNAIKPLHERREAMKRQHQDERRRLDAGLAKRWTAEQRQRAARIRGGVKGAWDLLTGRYWKARRQNEMEAFFAMQRDRAQRDTLIRDQLKERGKLQADLQQARTRQAGQLLALYRDAARFRQAQETRAPRRDTGLDFGR
jgi:MobA/VirD2-like, nuclease domain